ncbi:tyrosine-type recombinase/integrase [Roseibium album]|uniref:tyrosine-type recombinase/integrase n=1 Tax=Roseibium album TaxID=311410 RepID=UPI00391CA137
MINNAHELVKCPPIKLKGFTKAERLEQDRIRGKESRKPKTPGSWEWIISFREKANPFLGALALFMFTSGARITQSILIEPQDLDLPNGRIWMPPAKGHEGQWVDVIPAVVADLANLPARNGRVFGYQYRWSVYGAWKTACKNADIEYIPPHAAGRHGFGTEMIVRQGIDPVTAAEAGRWASPKILLDTYAHSEEGTARVHDAFRTGLVQATKGEALKPLKRKRK